MRGQLVKLALGVLLYACMAAPAQAATVAFSDVPATSWARTQITWSAANGWVAPRTTTTFGPGKAATRMAAARVLAHLAARPERHPDRRQPVCAGGDRRLDHRRHRGRPADPAVGVRSRHPARDGADAAGQVDRPPADRRRVATTPAVCLRHRAGRASAGRTRQRSRRVGCVGDLAAHAPATPEPGGAGLCAGSHQRLGAPGCDRQDRGASTRCRHGRRCARRCLGMALNTLAHRTCGQASGRPPHLPTAPRPPADSTARGSSGGS